MIILGQLAKLLSNCILAQNLYFHQLDLTKNTQSGIILTHLLIPHLSYFSSA